MTSAAPSLVTCTKLERVQLARLLQHVRDENREEIRRLVESGIPNLINYRDERTGETALSLAAVSNHEELVKCLLDVGAHPDVVDSYGRSAIMRAAAYGHIETLQVLAESGADLRLQDSSGRGVLFYCCTVGGRHMRCAEICINAGADVNCTTYEGLPLLVASCESAADCLQTCLQLIERGADPTSTDKRCHRTALMAACRAGAALVVKQLLYRGADVSMTMLPFCTNAAHDAAMCGNLDVLQALSAYRVNLDQLDQEANTPIHYAALHGHALCCRFLAQRGCNPKLKNANGKLARQLAKEGKFKAAVKECRRAEAGYGKPVKNGEVWALALYDFTCVQRAELLELFVKFDVEVTGYLSTEDFLDVLQSAGAPLADEDFMRRLVKTHEIEKSINYREFLSAKKYINKRFYLSSYEKKQKKSKGARASGKKTKIPMYVCTQADYSCQELSKVEHVTDMTRYGVDRRPEHALEDDTLWYVRDRREEVGESARVSQAVRFRDMLSLHNAVSNGELGVNDRDRYYKTPLMHACMKGDLSMVKYLCDNGADVNAVDNFRWTPLHFACHCGLTDVVQYLLDAGAVLESRALNGCTPLMHAIQSTSHSVVQLLLERGAKLRVENKKGHTPMTMAEDFANYPVYSVIKTRWDNLPPLKDKKRNQSSAATQRSAMTTAVASAATQRLETSQDDQRPDSSQSTKPLSRPQSSTFTPLPPPVTEPVMGKVDSEEDITYRLLDTWTHQQSSAQLIEGLRERRSRYGWQSDFSDYQLPFISNVLSKVSTVAS